MSDTGTRTASAGLIGAALLIVYLVWGSTYLGIRVVVQEVPPLLGMGTRYLTAGTLLALVLALRGGLGRLRVTRGQLLATAYLGLMLPVLGNGVVAVGESMGAESGITAVLIATTPLTITLLRTLSGDMPHPWTFVGVGLGFSGVAYLILAGRHGQASAPTVAALVIVLAATSWGIGSWSQPRLSLPPDAFVMTAYQMIIGGLILLTASFAHGDRVDVASLSTRTWVAWAYLIVFGSMIAFTAYVWLLANAPLQLVATYAYVNPVVAVMLGALILAEPITPTIIIGGSVIVAAVALVISVESPNRKAAARPSGSTQAGGATASDLRG